MQYLSLTVRHNPEQPRSVPTEPLQEKKKKKRSRLKTQVSDTLRMFNLLDLAKFHKYGLFVVVVIS